MGCQIFMAVAVSRFKQTNSLVCHILSISLCRTSILYSDIEIVQKSDYGQYTSSSSFFRKFLVSELVVDHSCVTN